MSAKVIDYELYTICAGSGTSVIQNCNKDDAFSSFEVHFVDEEAHPSSNTLPRPVDLGPNSHPKRDKNLSNEAKKYKKDIESLAVVFLCERIHVASLESSSWSTPSKIMPLAARKTGTKGKSQKAIDDFDFTEADVEGSPLPSRSKTAKIGDADTILNVILDYARPLLASGRKSLWTKEPHVLSEATSSGIANRLIIPAQTHKYDVKGGTSTLFLHMPTIVYLALVVPTKDPFSATSRAQSAHHTASELTAERNKAMSTQLEELLSDLAINTHWLRDITLVGEDDARFKSSDDNDNKSGVNKEQLHIPHPILAATIGGDEKSSPIDDFAFDESDLGGLDGTVGALSVKELPPRRTALKREAILFCLPYPSDLDPVPLSYDFQNLIEKNSQYKWLEGNLVYQKYSQSPLDPSPPYIGDIFFQLLKTHPNLFTRICNVASDPSPQKGALKGENESTAKRQRKKGSNSTIVNDKIETGKSAKILISLERGNYWFQRQIDYRGEVVPDDKDDRLTNLSLEECHQRTLKSKAAIKARLGTLMAVKKSPTEESLTLHIGTWKAAINNTNVIQKEVAKCLVDTVNVEHRNEGNGSENQTQLPKIHDPSKSAEESRGNEESKQAMLCDTPDDEDLTLLDLLAARPKSSYPSNNNDDEDDDDDDEGNQTLADMMAKVRAKKVVTPNSFQLTNTRRELPALNLVDKHGFEEKVNELALDASNMAHTLPVIEEYNMISATAFQQPTEAFDTPFVTSVIDVVLPYPSSRSSEDDYHEICRLWFEETVMVPSNKHSVPAKAIKRSELVASLAKALKVESNKAKLPMKPLFFAVRWEPQSLIREFRNVGFVRTTDGRHYRQKRGKRVREEGGSSELNAEDSFLSQEGVANDVDNETDIANDHPPSGIHTGTTPSIQGHPVKHAPVAELLQMALTSVISSLRIKIISLLSVSEFGHPESFENKVLRDQENEIARFRDSLPPFLCFDNSAFSLNLDKAYHMLKAGIAKVLDMTPDLVFISMITDHFPETLPTSSHGHSHNVNTLSWGALFGALQRINKQSPTQATIEDHTIHLRRCCAGIESDSIFKSLQNKFQYWLRKLGTTTPNLMLVLQRDTLPTAVGLVSTAVVPTKVMFLFNFNQLTSEERHRLRQSLMMVLGRALVSQCRDALDSHLGTRSTAFVGEHDKMLPGLVPCSPTDPIMRVLEKDTVVDENGALRLTVLYTKAQFRVSIYIRPPQTNNLNNLTAIQFLLATILVEAPICTCTVREGLDGNGSWKHNTLSELSLCHHIIEVVLWYLMLADRYCGTK